jgi:N-acetylglucosamine-6-phosphate deacetylase
MRTSQRGRAFNLSTVVPVRREVMAGLPQFADRIRSISNALESPARPFAVRHATKIDATGVVHGYWMVANSRGEIFADGVESSDAGTDASELGGFAESVDGSIEEHGGDHGDEGKGSSLSSFERACTAVGLSPADSYDAQGAVIVPGYIDIHSHGGWGASFDDGPEGIDAARAAHVWHGTTRQVCSLITNPLDVMARNIATVREKMKDRPDILGSHLEGPFLALSRKGAHDPKCLCDPDPQSLAVLLEAGKGTIRQITLAPERTGGLTAVRTMAKDGVIPAVGHTDCDYATARAAFNAGARILTHLFDAMNGLEHRNPGPIPAALEDPRVTVEFINDGFHVRNPMVRFGFAQAPHRIALITDAMAAAGCPDGRYKLGELDVNVRDGHARLVSNGAIAGSTLVLEKSVQRLVLTLGISPVAAVEAATLTPAHALGIDRPNQLTGSPLGLLQPGYAADALIVDPATWDVQHVWCAGRRVR